MDFVLHIVRVFEFVSSSPAQGPVACKAGLLGTSTITLSYYSSTLGERDRHIRGKHGRNRSPIGTFTHVEITSIDWSKTFRYVGSKIELGVNSSYLGFCAYCKIRNAMRMYHCEVRPTFSLRFKQTMELYPDMNISSYSSAVSSLLHPLPFIKEQSMFIRVNRIFNSAFVISITQTKVHLR